MGFSLQSDARCMVEIDRICFQSWQEWAQVEMDPSYRWSQFSDGSALCCPDWPQKLSGPRKRIFWLLFHTRWWQENLHLQTFPSFCVTPATGSVRYCWSCNDETSFTSFAQFIYRPQKFLSTCGCRASWTFQPAESSVLHSKRSPPPEFYFLLISKLLKSAIKVVDADGTTEGDLATISVVLPED